LSSVTLFITITISLLEVERQFHFEFDFHFELDLKIALTLSWNLALCPMGAISYIQFTFHVDNRLNFNLHQYGDKIQIENEYNYKT